jgi:outer membrane receptor protein involved in Fe transport
VCPDIYGQTGTIAGTVTGEAGGEPVPFAIVSLLPGDATAVTDRTGDYTLIQLPAGYYTLQVAADDYASRQIVNIKVETGRTIHVDAQLQSHALKGDTVHVRAVNDLLRPDVSYVTTYIDAEELSTAPGSVVGDYLQHQQGGRYTRHDRARWLSFRGGSWDETDVLVDGQSTLDPHINRAWLGVNKTAIEEVIVESGGFTAEYGSVRSGLINIVTRNGLRQDYQLALEGQYSFPHLKHFGRNLYDRSNPVIVARAGRNNFIPGVFDDGVFQATGDPVDWGTRGEVVIDETSPSYRGFFYQEESGNYTDNNNEQYTEADIQRYQMDPVQSYPDFLAFEGYKQYAEYGGNYPAEWLAEWLWMYQSTDYGHNPDYNLDVTFSGPVPGASIPFVGSLLGRTTFMLSYRNQTSRFVFPSSRNAYRDRNLQGKITMQIAPGTRLRLTALYGAAKSIQRYRYMGSGLPDNSQALYYDDNLDGTLENITGIRGSGMRAQFDQNPYYNLYNAGDNLQNNQYRFHAAAKLTHAINAHTSIEMEYQFEHTVSNANPMWPRDKYTTRSWVFNIDGLENNRGEPRTFVTSNPSDVFVAGITQYFDPVLAEQVRGGVIPPEHLNARGMPFSTGGDGTWVYSRDLLESWYWDRVPPIFTSNVTFQRNTLKGMNRLWLSRGYDDTGAPVVYEEPADLDGSFDLDHVMNFGRMYRDMTWPASGGLMDGQTLPGITLIKSMISEKGWDFREAHQRGYPLTIGGGGKQIIRNNGFANRGRLSIVSQVTRHNQIKAGVDFTFRHVTDMFTNLNYATGSFLGARSGDFFNIDGNWDTKTWFQYRDNPVEIAAYLQDKIEAKGIVANIGVRMDYFDPTTTAVDLSDPYRPEFSWYALYPVNAPSHFNAGTPRIKARPQVMWSPRFGLSFPVTDHSKIYTNYGWYYQRPTMDQLYSYTFSASDPLQIPNSNLHWPRAAQWEFGFAQNLKDWFQYRIATYYKDMDDIVTIMQWMPIDQSQVIHSLANNGYRDARGLEISLERRVGLFRTRLLYDYMRQCGGRVGRDSFSNDMRHDIGSEYVSIAQTHEVQAQPVSGVRWTGGFFSPQYWGWRVGENVHPFGDITINAVYTWEDAGKLLLEQGVNASQDVWIPRINRSNTDIRMEKRFRVGPATMGIFMQVFNLFNQKYLEGPHDNPGIRDDDKTQYLEVFKERRLAENPDEYPKKWGEYKHPRLQNTLPWYWDQVLFSDKRDVFYGLTLTWQ